MKGLILKDIYEVRFQVIIGMLIALYPNILMLIALMDIAGDFITSGNDVMFTALCGFLNYITIVPFSSLVLNTLTNDASSGWAKIRRTMPVSNEQATASKLIATGGIVGLFTVISLIINIIMMFIYNTADTTYVYPEIAIAAPLCIGLLQMFALSPVFPLAIRFGVKATNIFYLIFMIISAIAAIVVVFAAFSGDISMIVMRISFYAVLPVVAFLSVFISYKSGKNLVARDL